jgi:hypothetical protein
LWRFTRGCWKNNQDYYPVWHLASGEELLGRFRNLQPFASLQSPYETAMRAIIVPVAKRCSDRQLLVPLLIDFTRSSC